MFPKDEIKICVADQRYAMKVEAMHSFSFSSSVIPAVTDEQLPSGFDRAERGPKEDDHSISNFIFLRDTTVMVVLDDSLLCVEGICPAFFVAISLTTFTVTNKISISV